MKRILLMIVSIILIFNICSIDVEKIIDIQQYNIEVKQNVNKRKIEKILCGYFSSKLENQKDLEVTNNPYIDPESKLNKYDNLDSILTVTWYRGIEEKVIWYDVMIKINSLEYIDDFIRIDVDNMVSLQYKNLRDTSSYTEHHIIYIKDKKEVLLIQRDICNDDLLSNEEVKDIYLEDNYEDYINKKISSIINRINMLDIEINEFNRKNNIVCRWMKNEKMYKYKKYNGSIAAKWARENVNSPEDYKGEDCTNFVSKALRNGGMPVDHIWYNDSVAWVGVIELREWLLDNGYAIEYSYANCEEGDIIQFYNSNYDRWSHSVIVTYVNSRYSSGHVYISAHTNAANNIPLFKYYPTETYPKMRCLKIVY